MNGFRSVSALCFVALCSGQVCLSADSTAVASEIYSPRVLIQGTWGSGANEFGLRKPSGDDLPFVGPDALTVDTKEDIYILDPVNARIKVYNKGGSYASSVTLGALGDKFDYTSAGANELAVDSGGRIFLRTSMVPNDVRVVVEISRQGQLRRVHILKANFDAIMNNKRSMGIKQTVTALDERREVETIADQSGEIAGLFVDATGTAYVRTRNNAYRNLTDAADISTCDGSLSKDRKFVYIRSPKIPDPSTLPPIRGMSVLGIHDGRRRELAFTLPSEWQAEGWQMVNATIASEDKMGNAYAYIWAELRGADGTQYSNEVNDLVYKYDSRWRMVAAIEIPVVDPVYRIPLAYGSRGSVYQLAWNSNDLAAGVKILRWDPAERRAQ